MISKKNSALIFDPSFLVCNSSSSVSALTQHLRLSCTHLLHTLLNFPLPFNITVILTYTNTSRVNAFGRLLVVILCGRMYVQSQEFGGSASHMFDLMVLDSLVMEN